MRTDGFAKSDSPPPINEACQIKSKLLQLNRCRRLVKDYENLARNHAAFIILAMIRLMLRRIVRHAGAI